MCGRFTLKTPVADWLADLFPSWVVDPESVIASIPVELTLTRFNIAPSQQIVVVRCGRDGKPIFEGMRWGLVPSWSTSLTGGYNMINARSESLADKPSFRPLLTNQRCAILTDGYYEWKKLTAKTKEPYWIHTKCQTVFAMAGLWAQNRQIPNPLSPGNPIRSATIITTQSNTDVLHVHDRMPAILPCESKIADWLSPSLNDVDEVERLLAQLQPSPVGVLQLRQVSTMVNSPASDAIELLHPIE